MSKFTKRTVKTTEVHIAKIEIVEGQLVNTLLDPVSLVGHLSDKQVENALAKEFTEFKVVVVESKHTESMYQMLTTDFVKAAEKVETPVEAENAESDGHVVTPEQSPLTPVNN